MAIVRNLAGSDRISIRHPVFWFDDGSIVVRVQDYLFKVHRSLLSRHSNFFAHSQGITTPDLREDLALDCDYIVVDHEKGVLAQDVEVLLEHLYHDVSLFSEAPPERTMSALRVSSPLQLDFPAIHTLAIRRLLLLYNGSVPFLQPSDLGEALDVAYEYGIMPMQKAIYYMLVASSDYDFSSDKDDTPLVHDTEAATDSSSLEQDAASITEQSEPLSNSGRLNKDARPHVLSQIHIKRCSQLMTCLIDHFTPILFTPPATPHIPCTDVFADMWMSFVIQPGLENDAVYKPLETLQRMKDIDWAQEGLCQLCVEDKRQEWTEEQRNIWNLMDKWIKFD